MGGMATLTAARSDVFPPGTSVAVIPVGGVHHGGPPKAATIVSGTVDAAGLLSVTDANILSLTAYGLYAQVGGEYRYLRARSTLDVYDRGTATGTVNTTNGSANLSSVSASVGAFTVGQFITGPGIPAGTRLKSGSGAAWVMDANATVTASSVAVAAYGGQAPAANVGATLIPSRLNTPWATQYRQRKSIAGIN